MIMPEVLRQGWATLSELSPGEFGLSLGELLKHDDVTQTFKRLARLVAVSVKCPFAQAVPYDPDLPSNWAKASRGWEIHEPISQDTIRRHQEQFALLEAVAREWRRPVEFLAEYNIVHYLCKKLRPVVCGEAKVLENAEKIARDLNKQGNQVAYISLNALLGATSLTVASYLAQSIPLLSGNAPLVAGTTLLVLCFGQARLCKLLTGFVGSNDPKKDKFAGRVFPVCGSLATIDGKPCEALVRAQGDRCSRHRGNA